MNYTDPDGREVTITISAKQMGSGMINAYHDIGSTSLSFLVVPTYEMTVSRGDGKTYTFEVTRNAHDAKENPSDFTFNPIISNESFSGIIEHRPDGSGDAIKIIGADGKAATFFSSQLGETNKDGALYIHVGGEYFNPKKNEIRFAVSTGCFTLNGKDAGNAGVANFIDTVKDLQMDLKRAGADSSIIIKIEVLE